MLESTVAVSGIIETETHVPLGTKRPLDIGDEIEPTENLFPAEEPRANFVPHIPIVDYFDPKPIEVAKPSLESKKLLKSFSRNGLVMSSFLQLSYLDLRPNL